MALLKKEIQKAEGEVSGLLQQYEQESRDVEQIQKESLSAFLFKLIGKYEDKLEKEQREEIYAKLTYDRAATHLAVTDEYTEVDAGRWVSSRCPACLSVRRIWWYNKFQVCDFANRPLRY